MWFSSFNVLDSIGPLLIPSPTCCYLNDPIPNNQMMIVDGNKHPFCVYIPDMKGNKCCEENNKTQSKHSREQRRMNSRRTSTAEWRHVSYTPGAMCICSLIADAHIHMRFLLSAHMPRHTRGTHTHTHEQTPGFGLREILVLSLATGGRERAFIVLLQQKFTMT